MGSNDEIKDRLKAVLTAKNMSVSKITEGEDVKRSTLSAQINGNSSVSAETIKLFLKKFQDLSAEWLTRGIGSMFCCGESSIDEMFNNTILQHNVNVEGDNNPIMNGDAVLHKENEMLKNQIEILKNHIAKQDEEIKFLRSLVNK